jgi:signal transduction histidine kinase
VELNFATTVSFSAAATCLALATLGAYLGRTAAARRFRHAATAGVAAAVFCVTNAIIAGQMSVGATLWAGRLSLTAATVHGAAWLAFLAAWDRRPLSRLERVLVVASLVGGALSLVPGLTVLASTTDRQLVSLGITYRDPDVGPLGSPIMALAFAEQIVATLAALRMSRSLPTARVVTGAMALICAASLSDWAAAVHLVDLPYLTDPSLALALLSIGSVVVADAAESATKSAELARARVELAERENLAAVGQLAAVVAHEVRNPVGIIFGALATLQRGARTEEEQKVLAIVGEEAERLKQLVTRLLDAVRPFELQYSRHPAEEIVRDAVAQVTAGAGAPADQVDVVRVPPAEVECDKILLGQAVSNLVQNALVANGRTAPVRIDASVEPSQPPMLRIEVTDDGDGVPVEARPRLFTPFFTTRATGTGLGLALVKRIAGAHGGTVDYEPPGGGGATFVLRVPLRARHVTPRRLLGGDVQ